MISQVVMSVARVFYYLALPSQHQKMVHPLLRLLAMSLEAERVVLAYILSISHTASVRLAPYHTYLDN
jgi:AP-3 complex subunit beta